MKPRTLNEILTEALSYTAPELQFEVMRRTLKPYLDLPIVGPGGAKWLLDGTEEELGRVGKKAYLATDGVVRDDLVAVRAALAIVNAVLAHLKVKVPDDDGGDVIEGEYSAECCEITQENGSFFVDLDPEKYDGERVRIRISKVEG